MRLKHFEELRPICPRCRRDFGLATPIVVHKVIQEIPGMILEGLLLCSNPSCLQEYPIMDGVPVIVPSVRSFVAQQEYSLLVRHDLSPTLRTLIGDCCGPDASFEVLRRYLSTYGYAHWADQDPEEEQPAGSIVGLIEAGLNQIEGSPSGPILDLGCAMGRSSVELAQRTGQRVLGIDLSFPMVQRAAAMMRTGHISYPKRRIGLVYETRAFPVQVPDPDQLDFWACDASALPFADESIGLIASLNLLDSLASPYAHLTELSRLLHPTGQALLSSPFEWSTTATAYEEWIGGHSQRSERGGDVVATLRAMLSPGEHPHALSELEIRAELDKVPWQLRIHDRCAHHYEAYLAILGKRSGE